MLRVSIAALVLFVATPAISWNETVQDAFERRRHQTNMELEASEANSQARQRAIDEDLTHYYMRNPPERGVGF